MKRLTCTILILMLMLTGCAQKGYSRTFFAMDTYIDMTVGSKAQADSVEKEIKRLDNLLSVTKKDSDTSRFNNGLSVSDETAALIERCDKISALTDGAFDIRIQSLVELWDVANAKAPPTDKAVASALDDKSKIGLGAVAKGYAASRVRSILTDKGVKSALVSLGGNVMLIGSNPEGRAWNVGIQHPKKADDIIGIITASDCAVVTSGGYQRYFECDGKRYHHIFDPKTGYPADSGIISATVISKDDTLADALSTAVYVMGVEKATKLYKTQDIELIMVTNDKVYVTKGLDFKLEDTSFKLEVITK